MSRSGMLPQTDCVDVIGEFLPCTAADGFHNCNLGLRRQPQELTPEVHVVSDDEAEWQPDWRSSDSEGIIFPPHTPAAQALLFWK